MIGNSIAVANFSQKLLMTRRQVSSFCKTFANNLSANIKLSKTQLSEIMQSSFLRRISL